MNTEEIKTLALANGFKLKEQANGNMDLNAYVYDFNCPYCGYAMNKDQTEIHEVYESN